MKVKYSMITRNNESISSFFALTLKCDFDVNAFTNRNFYFQIGTSGCPTNQLFSGNTYHRDKFVGML